MEKQICKYCQINVAERLVRDVIGNIPLCLECYEDTKIKLIPKV